MAFITKLHLAEALHLLAAPAAPSVPVLSASISCAATPQLGHGACDLYPKKGSFCHRLISGEVRSPLIECVHLCSEGPRSRANMSLGCKCQKKSLHECFRVSEKERKFFCSDSHVKTTKMSPRPRQPGRSKISWPDPTGPLTADRVKKKLPPPPATALDFPTKETSK